MNTESSLVIHDLHVGDSNVRIHAPASEQWAAEWITGLQGTDQTSAAPASPDLTLVLGALSQAVETLSTLDMGRGAPAVVLAPGCANQVDGLPRDEWGVVLEALGECRAVFVTDPADLRSLCARAPRLLALIADAAGTSPRDVMREEIRRARASMGTVLVHTGRAWIRDFPASLNLQLLRDRLEDLGQGPVLCEHWLPAEPAKRDSEGYVEARRAAWYLHCAAEATQAQVLLTDRFDVLNALVTSPNIRVPLGWFVTADALSGMLQRPPRNVAGVLKRLRSSHGLVVVPHESLVPMLSQLGDDGPVTVLDPDSDSFTAELEGVLRRVRPLTRLAQDTTLLIAGHDFKFLGELVDSLSSVPELSLRYDTWSSQDRHDVGESDTALEGADVILCEFASHNAVWYSWHKLPGQRLVVRFHGYELFQEQARNINIMNVDCFVFVSRFYRDRVVTELGWPVEKTTVIPNMVDASDFDRPKHPDARFHLGIAGIVPILKRPDRALDLLEALLAHDERYVLHLRGRAPWDYHWVWRQAAVQDAYRAVYDRLAEDPELLAHVSFDEFGADMGQWFQRIGWSLSPSVRETFHLAPVEGQMSGAVPVVWNRDGADEVFGQQWVHADTAAAAAFVQDANHSAESFAAVAGEARRDAGRYEVAAVAPLWAEQLFGQRTGWVGVAEQHESAAMEEELARAATADLLDRRIVLALARGEDLSVVSALMERLPEQAALISGHTRASLARAHDQQALQSGSVGLPPRVLGAAYLPRRYAVLTVACHIGAAASGADGPSAPHDVLSTQLDGTTVGEPVAVASDGRVTTRLQVFADAVVRTARVHRPAFLSVDPANAAAWPAVIAARRLGVPIIAHGAWDSGLPAPVESEFDIVVPQKRALAREDMDGAQRRHDELASRVAHRQLEDIVVGLIADEFTSTTISARCTTVPIPRRDAYLSVISHDLDVLFVESAWSGPNRDWFHGVAYYPDGHEDIERAIFAARARGIPVVFWNKEDPVHFAAFAATAALCDAVYTTDAAKIPDYMELFPPGAFPVVASMPFYAEPLLHNPLPGTWAPVGTVCYAGTYYGERYAERSRELDRILQQAAPLGLTIYDRQATNAASPYRFPQKYAGHIRGGLSYAEVLQAYKAHPVHINVNSVSDSPSMYSRRVVEIAASGTVVASGVGTGLRASIPQIHESDDPDELGAFMRRCMNDPGFWRQEAWRQLRAVRRSYLAEQSLAIMLRGAGVPVALPPVGQWTAHVEALDIGVARELLEQTLLPTEVVALHTDDEAVALLSSNGVSVVARQGAPWSTEWAGSRREEWAEDLLYAARFVPEDVGLIGSRVARATEHGLTAWESATNQQVMRRRGSLQDPRTLVWLTAEAAGEKDDDDA